MKLYFRPSRLYRNRASQVEKKEQYGAYSAGADVELWGDLYVVMPGMSEEYFLDIARKWCIDGLNGGFFFYEPGKPVELGEINWKLRRLTAT